MSGIINLFKHTPPSNIGKNYFNQDERNLICHELNTIDNNIINEHMKCTNPKNEILFNQFFEELIKSAKLKKVAWRNIILDLPKNFGESIIDKVIRIVHKIHNENLQFKLSNLDFQTYKYQNKEIQNLIDVCSNQKLLINDLVINKKKDQERMLMQEEENLNKSNELRMAREKIKLQQNYIFNLEEKSINNIKLIRELNSKLKEYKLMIEEEKFSYKRNLNKFQQEKESLKKELNIIINKFEDTNNRSISFNSQKNELKEANKAISFSTEVKTEVELKPDKSFKINLINFIKIIGKRNKNNIFNFLQLKDILNLSKVSKKIRSLSIQNFHFWENLIQDIKSQNKLKIEKLIIEIEYLKKDRFKFDLEIKPSPEKVQTLNKYIDKYIIQNNRIAINEEKSLNEIRYFLFYGQITPPKELGNSTIQNNDGGLLSSIGGLFSSNNKSKMNSEEKMKALIPSIDEKTITPEGISSLLTKGAKLCEGNQEKMCKWMSRLQQLFGIMFKSLISLVEESKKMELLKDFLSDRFDYLKGIISDLKEKLNELTHENKSIREYMDASSKRIKELEAQKINYENEILSRKGEIKVKLTRY